MHIFIIIAFKFQLSDRLKLFINNPKFDTLT